MSNAFVVLQDIITIHIYIYVYIYIYIYVSLGHHGPSWDPLGLLRGDPASTPAPPNMLTSPFDLPTSVFFTPYVPRRTSSLDHLSRNMIETNIFLLLLELRLRLHFLTFAIFGRPRALPGAPLESVPGPCGPHCPPLKFWNGLLGPPGPSRGSLSGCH